jgi:hypothetical protein
VTTGLTPDSFRERFALAAFDDGGIVLDVTSGSYWRLNASAAIFCSAFESASTERDALFAVANRTRLPTAVVETQWRTISGALGAPGTRGARVGTLDYRATDGGAFDLFDGETRVMHVGADGGTVTLCAQLEGGPFTAFDYLKALAPKVLSLKGHLVLHGSAVGRGSEGIAMCGVSGAGKTTTARCLARAGCTLLAEDLLVLDPATERASLFRHGERAILRWCAEGKARLQAPGTTFSTARLLDALSGETVGLDTIWFVDAQRRGPHLRHAPISRSVALEQILSHAFLGTFNPDRWRQYLESTRRLTQDTRGFELWTPLGLEQLEAAVQSYVTSSAS